MQTVDYPDSNYTPATMQRGLLEWLRIRRFQPAHIARICQCSVRRGAQILRGDTLMSFEEFSRALHESGRAWPAFELLPVVREEFNPSTILTARQQPKPRSAQASPIDTAGNNKIVLTISLARRQITDQMPLPASPTGDEGEALMQMYFALVARLPEDDAARRAALVRFCTQVSSRVAQLVLRTVPHERLAAYCLANPDALRTKWDLIAGMGGRLRSPDALGVLDWVKVNP